MTDRAEFLARIKLSSPSVNINNVGKAFDLAQKFHGDQKRFSGEPYFYHPLQVAEIISQMNLDEDSIITALLHDTVEDTALTLGEIRVAFGDSVASLVDGVTKLAKIKFQADHTAQAENFRKLLLAMSKDIRVLLVKLADRLHNMRTIDFIPSPEKRVRIAIETKEIYAPLAERIGMQQVKLELHDTSFRILHPEIRESILNRLSKLAIDGKELVNKIIKNIEDTMKDSGLVFEVHGRQKTPYSIWQKMKLKNVSFEQLSDIIAFRIIVHDVLDCYKTLGIMHTKYKMVPDNFQDFISLPKNNGYQSIHTIVIGPEQQRIEIQIRTREMHDIAEMGVAAHWLYKQRSNILDGTQFRWIRELLNILDQASDSEEFLQNTKLEMYYDQVFCFTPKGALIALPRGATPIDFAYALHSDLGHRCVGTKINGRIVPLRTILNNGDQVEIITSKNQTPSPTWESFVATGKARAEIRKFIRTQAKQEYTNLGKTIFEKIIKNKKLGDDPETINKILKHFKKNRLEELYSSLGEGVITKDELVNFVAPESKPKIIGPLSFFKIKKKEEKKEEISIPIKGLIPNIALNFAACCHPIPGDHIVGIIHSGKGVTVHTADCEMLANYASSPDRLMDLNWDHESTSHQFIARLRATLLNEPGSLGLLTTEIAKEKGNITYFKISNKNSDFFDVVVDIEVAGVNHLEHIITTLRSKSPIYSVERFKL